MQLFRELVVHQKTRQDVEVEAFFMGPKLLAVKRDHSQSISEERRSEVLKHIRAQLSSVSGWPRWSDRGGIRED